MWLGESMDTEEFRCAETYTSAEDGERSSTNGNQCEQGRSEQLQDDAGGVYKVLMALKTKCSSTEEWYTIADVYCPSLLASLKDVGSCVDEEWTSLKRMLVIARKYEQRAEIDLEFVTTKRTKSSFFGVESCPEVWILVFRACVSATEDTSKGHYSNRQPGKALMGVASFLRYSQKKEDFDPGETVEQHEISLPLFMEMGRL
ncbi:hypothetical protein ACH5RR_029936 [Cinchona calisaya]|uniref:Uncharacterized protein n=1 Tax=Cinchona calisaya TaxID=153742 RepID=A0ABD2YWZ3_9GENT